MIKLPFTVRSFDAGRNNPALLIHVQISGIRTGIIVPDTDLENDINVFFWDRYVIVDVVFNEDDRKAKTVLFDVYNHSTVLPYAKWDFTCTTIKHRQDFIKEFQK